MFESLMQFLKALFPPAAPPLAPEQPPSFPEPFTPPVTPVEDTNMDLNSIIAKYAAEYGIPVELVKAVIKVESSNDTWAARYEPGYYSSYIAGKGRKVPSGVSRDTEEHSQATSYGLMQVMGGTARDEGFAGKFLTELCDPEVGVKYGCKHLSTHSKRLTKAKGYGWDAVCAAYNGGAGAVKGPGQYRNAEYPAKVLQTLGGRWPAREA